jgi:hypothetical protein
MTLSRAEQLKATTPQLTAEVTLYSTGAGGRKTAVQPGWGCPCYISKESNAAGYDAWPLLGDSPLAPGESRQLGFIFLSGEKAAAVFRKAGVFFLWELGFIGEAKVI